ncbi:MAG: T9SS type A sorting domain-containing protein [Calditrichaceae bacterium]|nr:T9SS type A sorting domain-containing protein [Calditrichaceae bacterium]MBN2708141.1 T9SS type A sorting domain-containing protein [Calditrichaceae bacterium]
MNKINYNILYATVFLIIFNLYGQLTENCFLVDFEPKTAEIPQSVAAEKPTDSATVTVTINTDTLGKISKYVFGNAIAAWAGAHDHPLFIEGVELLAPTLIRMPGGSWSNGYFWNGIPPDVPDSIYDGTTYDQATGKAEKNQFYGQSGTSGDITTPDQYYALRENTNVSEGLITINYAYARYGTSQDPVARAAHLAAEWVRYDNGRTKFWEIGNENGGPWEYGWMIDTTLNKDGQPVIITGELYGRHFKVFADSMKAAAAEIGHSIYIGGQVVIYGEDSWNFVDRTWNEGFFKEVGDKADFYVVHSYFGYTYQAKYLLNVAVSEPKNQLDDLKQNFTKYDAYPKPVALGEYGIGLGATEEQATSYINGMQAVILVAEMIKNNFGLGARWLLLSWTTQMFYNGPEAAYLYHPRPEFYYLHYLPKFYGDHVISTTSPDKDIVCYASKYTSGEKAVIIVNKGTVDQIVSLKISGVGENYYVYLFVGGTDDPEFSQNVYINGYGPSATQWGPYDDLTDIPADAYTIGDSIKVNSPARSIQMIMIEGGDNNVAIGKKANAELPHSFSLYQNYPNPFNPSTRISYQLSTSIFVTIKVYDVLGKEVKTLVNEHKTAGKYSMEFNASKLPSGLYFYTMNAGRYSATKKLLLIK